MVFIDDLAFELFTIAFAGFLILYMTVKMYSAYKKGEKNLNDYLRSAIVPITILGIFMFIMGLYGEFTWPLPGSYNILFFDPYTLFGIVILSASVSIILHHELKYAGFLALMAGVVVIDYGYQGYILGLTQAPLALLGLFVSAGLAGILAFPVTLMLDTSNPKRKTVLPLCFIIFALFGIFLLLTSVAAGAIGFAAIPAHLLSAP